MNHPDRRSAFTLLETVLAVGLSALLIALMGAGIRIYTSTVAQRRADVVHAQLARVVLQRIANDLRGAYSMAEGSSGGSATDVGLEDDTTSDSTDTDTDTSDTSDTSTDTTTEETAMADDLSTATVQPTPGLYGNQSQLQIDVLGQRMEPIRYDTLLAAGVDPKTANLLSDPKVITYFVSSLSGGELAGTPVESFGSSGQQTVLVRRVVSRAEAAFSASYGETSDNSADQFISDQVALLQFMYHDGFDWLDSWDSSLAGGLPVAVNISIAIVDENADPSDADSLTNASVFEQTVYLPTAELPDDTTDTGI